MVLRRALAEHLAAQGVSDPLLNLEYQHLTTQAPLHVAVQHGRQSIGGDDLVDGRVIEVLLHLRRGVEVRDHEDDAAGVCSLQPAAAFGDGITGADHVVDHHHIAAGEVFEAGRGIGPGADIHLALAATLLFHEQQRWPEADQQVLGVRLQLIVHLLHEGSRAVVRGADHKALIVAPRVHDGVPGEVIHIEVGGLEVEEQALELLGEDPLHRNRVIVHGDHPVDATGAQQLRIEPAAEGLTVELLAVFAAAGEGGLAMALLRSAVLGAVEQVGLHQHDAGRAIVLGGPRDQAVAHGAGIAGVLAAAGGDDDDRLAT